MDEVVADTAFLDDEPAAQLDDTDWRPLVVFGRYGDGGSHQHGRGQES